MDISTFAMWRKYSLYEKMPSLFIPSVNPVAIKDDNEHLLGAYYAPGNV